MAVQQNKKSPSKRNMRRSHDALRNPTLSIEPSSGEVHLRHHISPNGYYRGKQVIQKVYPGSPWKDSPLGMTIHIAIDCMGGDYGPSVTVPAALHFLHAHLDAELILVGQTGLIQYQLEKHKTLRSKSFSVHAASEVVAMDDPIEIALRKKKDSSMRIALSLVKAGQAHACVSAGNTGALMAISRYMLKTLAGIERPAFAAVMPHLSGGTTMLDLGANIDCSPRELLRFAEMGHALVSAIEGKEKPAIGLLNNGEEMTKGNETVKQAGELLRASTLNFLRKCGRKRYLQGSHRYYRLRRLCRQCGAEDLRRTGQNARRYDLARILPHAAEQSDGGARLAGAQAPQASR